MDPGSAGKTLVRGALVARRLQILAATIAGPIAAAPTAAHAAFPLPPRQPGGGNPFTDFSGGGYFYLDDRDRAVIPTTTREIWIVRETTSPAGPGFVLDRAYDLNGTVAPDDKVISALPDWHGL